MRTFRDGHTGAWWAAQARLGGWGPDRRSRLVVVTPDPATLPTLSTWYLLTNLPREPQPGPGGLAPADLAEVVRLDGLRIWVEQGSKQVKGQLGWADFQVRSARAICRHFVLVCCAFSFCWHATHGVADPQPPNPNPNRHQHDRPRPAGPPDRPRGGTLGPHPARWTPPRRGRSPCAGCAPG